MVLAVGLAHRTLAGYQVRFLESVFMVLRSLMAGERDCDSRRYGFDSRAAPKQSFGATASTADSGSADSGSNPERTAWKSPRVFLPARGGGGYGSNSLSPAQKRRPEAQEPLASDPPEVRSAHPLPDQILQAFSSERLSEPNLMDRTPQLSRSAGHRGCCRP